uniref:Transmembrane protein 184C n=1 Tax=Guillardia theta TaxID=55529 RepID=A0A7S4PJ80_GUITH|mmetsp:Transcript_52381/g.162603  ORF Transcript_52381/g.162603 Transcript_52381/m.162603 type:complete len:476 (+) Transcript_52381:282-1709(+)
MISHSCASVVFTVLFVLAGIVLAACPLVVFFLYDNFKDRVPTHTIGWLIATCFVAVTLPISIWEIIMHLRYMQVPLLQVPVIRILWMVPIYTVDSWLALRFSWTELRTLSLYINVARECYEAFVVYNFLIFLARYVAIAGSSTLQREESSMGNVARSSSVNTETCSEEGSRKEELRNMDAQLKRILARKPAVPHIFPMSCMLEPWDTTSTAHHESCLFLSRVKSGVVQYIVVKLACALAAFILKPLSMWGEGRLQPSQGFFWAAMVTNFSQAWALYCLILFYKGLRHELAPMKPLGKFLAVKAIVFFSFWQSLAIAILVQLDVIAEIPSIYPETSELAAATQDFLICIEMLIFAIVHHTVFSYREFLHEDPQVSNIELDVENSEPGRKDFKSSLKAMVDLDDLWQDTRGTLAPILPRRPYPVFKVPQTIRSSYGRDSRSTGSSMSSEVQEHVEAGAKSSSTLNEPLLDGCKEACE